MNLGTYQYEIKIMKTEKTLFNTICKYVLLIILFKASGNHISGAIAFGCKNPCNWPDMIGCCVHVINDL